MAAAWFWSVKSHVRDCYVIPLALSLMRVTPRLPSSRLLRATQNCWYKPVLFQEWNINCETIFWLKKLI
jgi:hypothetical protein